MSEDTKNVYISGNVLTHTNTS